MATINHSSGADIIVPNNNGTTYRGLGGDDTYILSNSIAANAAITIVDTSGANKIQLVDGLSVASTKFAADAVQLTLSNGAVVTINGASNFDFDLGVTLLLELRVQFLILLALQPVRVLLLFLLQVL
jgi:hypothetical protein